MEKIIDWPLLDAKDIEVRIQSEKNGYLTLLLYQNSRTTINAFNKMFGNFGWNIEYKEVNGELYGRLGVKSPDTGEFLYKEDTGEESNIAAAKGKSSDILKRCAVRWGYAIELYSAPRIAFKGSDKYAKYAVSEIRYDEDRNIAFLCIVNADTKKTVFKWLKDEPIAESNLEYREDDEPQQPTTRLEDFRNWCKELMNKYPNDKDFIKDWFTARANGEGNFKNWISTRTAWRKDLIEKWMLKDLQNDK